jgi:hypothetical protein
MRAYVLYRPVGFVFLCVDVCLRMFCTGCWICILVCAVCNPDLCFHWALKWAKTRVFDCYTGFDLEK